MEWVEITYRLYMETHLLLMFPLSSSSCLKNLRRGTEEALAVGGALVLEFDVGA